jgi:hypothetical protein
VAGCPAWSVQVRVAADLPQAFAPGWPLEPAGAAALPGRRRRKAGSQLR